MKIQFFENIYFSGVLAQITIFRHLGPKIHFGSYLGETSTFLTFEYRFIRGSFCLKNHKSVLLYLRELGSKVGSLSNFSQNDILHVNGEVNSGLLLPQTALFMSTSLVQHLVYVGPHLVNICCVYSCQLEINNVSDSKLSQKWYFAYELHIMCSFENSHSLYCQMWPTFYFSSYLLGIAQYIINFMYSRSHNWPSIFLRLCCLVYLGSEKGIKI